MNERKLPRAFLDTNVLYPLVIRDILLWFAYEELFLPFWSKHVLMEWSRVMQRNGLTHTESQRRMNLIQDAFPFAMVRGYESSIEQLDFPDENDRHVLAAAIRVGADTIITQNLKDFPKSTLSTFGIVALNSDAFLVEFIQKNPTKALRAFKQMVKQRKRPIQKPLEVIQSLRNHGLMRSATLLDRLISKQ
ncbi:MAG: putative toxin-antitoxin system toxin component, PIN family [Flavobacteriales bacterium]|jgi:predicted nucleic acid-binding protein